MYAGNIVEQAPVAELFANPKHPYTIGLFNSLPKLHDRRDRLNAIPGQVPAATRMPSGCRFHPRCEHVMERCKHEMPGLISVSQEHCAACWLMDESVTREATR